MSTLQREADPQRTHRHPLVYVFPAAFGLLCAGYVSTQYLAWQIGYAATLGRPAAWPLPQMMWGACIMLGTAAAALFVYERSRRLAPLLLLLSGACALAALGPVYAPYRAAAWMWKAMQAGQRMDTSQYEWVSQHGLYAAAGGFAAGLAALLPPLMGRARQHTTSHGSAAWGTGEALMAAKEKQTQKGALDFILGRKAGKPLTYAGDSHLMTVAPTGSGKGVSLIIPNLLRYGGSVVVNDPKGENWYVTRRYRNEVLGQQCEPLDPFGLVTSTPASFNPVDQVDPGSPDAFDEAMLIADLLIGEDSDKGKNTHWSRTANGLWTGLVLYVALLHPPGSPRRTLIEARRLISLPSEKKRKAAEEHHTDGAGALGQPHGRPETWEELLRDMGRCEGIGGGDLVARASYSIRQMPDRERGSVISTARGHTRFLNSPRMEAVLTHSTFEPEDLRHEDLSLYLILPPKRISTYQPWQRLMIGTLLMGLTRTAPEAIAKTQPILFLLDEFTNMGRVDLLRSAVSLMRGYGFKLWFFPQDLGQLKETYREGWDTFLGNTDVQQFFATNHATTMEHVSKQAGDRTIFVENVSRSRSLTLSDHQRGENTSISEKGRRLIMPDEVRRMNPKKQILFVKGQRPVLADRVIYYEDEGFKERADPNPLVTGADTGAEGSSPKGPSG